MATSPSASARQTVLLDEARVYGILGRVTTLFESIWGCRGRKLGLPAPLMKRWKPYRESSSGEVRIRINKVALSCLLFVGAGFFLIPCQARALPLVITDCHGFTRAVHETQAGAENRIEVNVSSAQQQEVQVNLTNVVTGETQTAVASNGVAVFNGVTAGTFTLATTAEGVQLGAISIGSLYFAGGTAAVIGVTSGVVTGGAAAGVVVGVNDAVSGGGDSGTDSNPPPSPTPVPTPQPTPPECTTCDPDATPPPLGQDDVVPPGKVQLSPSN